MIKYCYRCGRKKSENGSTYCDKCKREISKNIKKDKKIYNYD